MGDFTFVSFLEGYDGKTEQCSNYYTRVVDPFGFDFIAFVGPGKPVSWSRWDCVGGVWIGLWLMKMEMEMEMEKWWKYVYDDD